MATNLLNEGIYEYTNNMLETHTLNNKDFNIELANAYEYYRARILDVVNLSDKEKVETELFQCIKSQIFNGYHMAQELINDEDSIIGNSWFEQPEGVLAQQLPDILRVATNYNIDEVITHKPLQTMASWLVIAYEGIYPLLMDISLNMACLGAKWAFLDQAEKRKIQLFLPQQIGHLAYLDDITFINPQTYMQCDITNENGEFWTIVSSNHSGLDKVGEVTLFKVTDNVNTVHYFMNINLKNSLQIKEQQIIIDNLASRLLLEQKIERNQLTLTAANIEEFYVINNR